MSGPMLLALGTLAAAYVLSALVGALDGWLENERERERFSPTGTDALLRTLTREGQELLRRERQS